ncbi:hypothetical protein NC653_018122 [Populus alba x Populus x berolinensis]|uniref:Glycolipid transfer protein domain-containing protein n=1 Tax=Populus alba x Populus x berolinensis TaxID=444605 RepID=A0AAD6W235_9ROSI|nr:hypothetical protein NC653_018122 [Populus alba x Populus x berolinensis]
MDYVAKVHDLAEASKSIDTLQDIERNSVRKGGSHSRNLLRVKRGLDMVRVLFEQIMVTEFVLNVDDNHTRFGLPPNNYSAFLTDIMGRSIVADMSPANAVCSRSYNSR